MLTIVDGVGVGGLGVLTSTFFIGAKLDFLPHRTKFFLDLATHIYFNSFIFRLQMYLIFDQIF